MFDRGNNGHVSSEELKKILQSEKMTVTDIEELLKDMGMDEDGDIDYEAFVKKLKK
ncbi:hypothetical protein D3C80_2140280 [compost metagenome]